MAGNLKRQCLRATFLSAQHGPGRPWQKPAPARQWIAAWMRSPSPAFASGQCGSKSKPIFPLLIAAFLSAQSSSAGNGRIIDWVLDVSAHFRSVAACVIRDFDDPHIFAARTTAGCTMHRRPAAMLGIFSLILLAKVFLYARIIHYGCWLAMPATMLLVIALFGWIPTRLRRRGGSAAAFSAGSGGAWTAVLLVHLAMSGIAMKPLTVSVGSGADQFWADAVRGKCVNNADPRRRANPAGQNPRLFSRGDHHQLSLAPANADSVRQFQSAGPAAVWRRSNDRSDRTILRRILFFWCIKTPANSARDFSGSDYGQKLNAWIEERYVEESLPMLDLGSEPFADNQFGIRLLVPRPPGRTSGV